jgi:pimeloyl-ACP methyl ester carboxylesterase
MPYLELGDVNTWWDEHGEGAPLVLLHPGGADSRAFDTTLALADRFHVYRFDRRGHGRTADAGGPISYAQMADDTAAFVRTVVGGPAHLLGHSDGAPVALLTAHRHADLVRRMVFASGVFRHDGWRPGVLDLNDEDAEFLRSWYAEVSPDGRDHYDVVAAKLDRMHRAEPTLTTTDLTGIATPTLLMFGDDDEVQPAHLHALHESLPDAELAIVPGAGHGVLLDKPDLCHTMITAFLTEDR